MKKYIKPEINIKRYDLNASITNLVSINGTMGHLDEYNNDAGSLNWTDLFN